jgi:threonyl-tRNA synthetase
VESNLSPEKIGAKIREASINKVPYMLILGDKEQQGRVVAIRHRTEGDKGQMPLSEFIARAKKEVEMRALSGS